MNTRVGTTTTSASSLVSTDITLFKVALDESDPLIWRRVVVPHGLTLRDLHEVLQVVMGWENKHLYRFRSGDRSFGPTDGGSSTSLIDDSKVRFNELAPKIGDVLHYEYDLGDLWKHTVALEEIVPADQARFRFGLIACKYRCPPEHIGGVQAFQRELRRPGNQRRINAPKRLFGRDFWQEDVPFNEINRTLDKLDRRMPSTAAKGD